MHRGAENEAVGGLGLLDGLVDHAAKHAAAALGTAAAADAAAHGFCAHAEDLRLNAAGVQLLGNEGKGGVGAAFFMGAAVDEKNFHGKYSPLLCRAQFPGKFSLILAQNARRCNTRPLTNHGGMFLI